MTKLIPPHDSCRYSGALAPMSGIEVRDIDVEALKKEGWAEIEKPKKKTTKEVKE